MVQNVMDINENTETNDLDCSKTESTIEIVNVEEQKLRSKKPKKRLDIEWIALIVVTIFFAAVFGSNFGYQIYIRNHPVKEEIVVGKANEIPTAEKMQQELDANTLVTNYGDKAYQVLNYAFYKQATHRYTLAVTSGKTHALIADQKIKSATLSTPECDYFENISSGFTSTAYRFYDYKDGTKNIKSMMCSTESDWKDKEPENMTYDDYIQKFGKLYKGKYYVTYDTSKDVPDTYLTDSEEEYNAAVKSGTSASVTTGISIYNMNSKTITESTIEEIETGYRISVTFNVSKGACSYFKAQMKTTGGVSVSFVSSSIIYELDKNLDLVHGKTIDSYKTVGVTADQLLDIYYYHNDVEAVFDNKMVLVPETNSTTTFNAYDLIPEEE